MWSIISQLLQTMTVEISLDVLGIVKLLILKVSPVVYCCTHLEVRALYKPRAVVH